MPPTVYDNAVAKRAKLVSERAAIDREIEKLDVFLAMYVELDPDASPAHSPAQDSPSAAPSSVAPTVSLDPVKVPPRRGLAQSDFEKLASEIILGTMRPQPLADLHALFQARDIALGGLDERRNLGTKLWKATSRENGPLINLPDHGYWVRSMPFPLGGYTPAAWNKDETNSQGGNEGPKQREEVFI